MYNGIGLQTPRGSGTNGHVQRNWASVRPAEKAKPYKTEEELALLDKASTRPPNQEILDHERKRKIELKCAEFADILEEQGFSEEMVAGKVDNYRKVLLGSDAVIGKPLDQWGRVSVRETHQVAEAQQEKNARLREAFGISEYFVEGSSFDPERQAKEKLAASAAAAERERQRALEKAEAARYQLVRTPSPEKEPLPKRPEAAPENKRKPKDSSPSTPEGGRKKKKKRKAAKKDK
uniref:CWF21 domain-containing protein n=2 Tax=Dendroctonus ponderosae TaxID=77166 RepID=A0AAR5Q6B8_DENPD